MKNAQIERISLSELKKRKGIHLIDLNSNDGIEIRRRHRNASHKSKGMMAAPVDHVVLSMLPYNTKALKLKSFSTYPLRRMSYLARSGRFVKLKRKTILSIFNFKAVAFLEHFTNPCDIGSLGGNCY